MRRSYLIVIHTPRICSEPGFKSQRDSVKAAPIRCRHIVPEDTVEFDRAQIESSVPHTLPPLRPILPPAPPVAPNQGKDKADAGKKTMGEDEKQAEFVKVAVGALFNSHAQDRALAGKKVRIELDNGVHELDFTDIAADAVEAGDVPDMDVLRNRLAKVLQAAGYDVRADEWTEEDEGKGKGGKQKEKSKGRKEHPEL